MIFSICLNCGIVRLGRAKWCRVCQSNKFRSVDIALNADLEYVGNRSLGVEV